MTYLLEHLYMYIYIIIKSKSMITTNFWIVSMMGGMNKDSIGGGYNIINNALIMNDYWYTMVYSLRHNVS